MVTLAALGCLQRSAAFPDQLTIDTITMIRIHLAPTCADSLLLVDPSHRGALIGRGDDEVDFPIGKLGVRSGGSRSPPRTSRCAELECRSSSSESGLPTHRHRIVDESLDAALVIRAMKAARSWVLTGNRVPDRVAALRPSGWVSTPARPAR